MSEQQHEQEAVACPPAIRCADRTLCPGPCRRAGNREGNHVLPTNPTADELARRFPPGACRDCGEPFVPVQRGECSRCGSDGGPITTPGATS